MIALPAEPHHPDGNARYETIWINLVLLPPKSCTVKNPSVSERLISVKENLTKQTDYFLVAVQRSLNVTDYQNTDSLTRQLWDYRHYSSTPAQHHCHHLELLTPLYF